MEARLLIIAMICALAPAGFAHAGNHANAAGPGSNPGQAADNAMGQGNRPDTPPELSDTPASGGVPGQGGGVGLPGAGSGQPGVPGGAPPVTPGASPEQIPDPSSTVMDAVDSGRAVSLDRVLAHMRTVADGDLIDSRLVTVRGYLLYELRVLLESGTVETFYYYATTGRPVAR